MNLAKKYGYLWVTLAFFIISIIGHWVFAWFAYVDEQQEHKQPIETRGYVIQTMRDTLENWQSEFLQLMWQVGGLAFLLFIGSPQSKEEEERNDEKLNKIIEKLYGKKEAAKIKQDLEKKYPKK